MDSVWIGMASRRPYIDVDLAATIERGPADRRWCAVGEQLIATVVMADISRSAQRGSRAIHSFL